MTSGTPSVIEQIKAQLDRMVPVHDVHDLTAEGASVERELALFKVFAKGEKRVESLRLADVFRAKVVDSTLVSFTFELTGTPEKIDAFADLMVPLGLKEIARTGVAALSEDKKYKNFLVFNNFFNYIPWYFHSYCISNKYHFLPK